MKIWIVTSIDMDRYSYVEGVYASYSLAKNQLEFLINNGDESYHYQMDSYEVEGYNELR